MYVRGILRYLCGFGFVFLALALVTATVSPAMAQTNTDSSDDFLAADDEEDVNDPIEPLNRVFFEFNEFFQGLLLRPVTEMYRLFIPKPVRTAIGNALDNLNSPIVLANDILQGEGTRAYETTSRFLVNSTLGVAGLFDVADELGIEEHSEDFGQTLAVWGLGEGFYLVLPFFGPSSPRDALGKHVVDGYFDAFGMYFENTHREEVNYTRTGLGALDEYGGVMDELDQVKKTSIDYYAAIRSMYRQKRKAEIRNGEDVDLPPIPDLSFEFDEDDIEEPATESTEFGRQNSKPDEISQY